MNKVELIASIAEKTGLTKKDSEKALNAVICTLTGALVKEEKIAIAGFGTFEVRHKAARTGKNPPTGAASKIAASKAPAFKAGKALKDAVAGK